jgi:DNA primase
LSILSESNQPLNLVPIRATSSHSSEATEHQPYGLRKSIEAVKAAVAIEDYLQERGVELKHNRARCIVHDGDNPQSFAVYPDEGRWYCFRCSEGGDVVDLCRAVEGGELWEAVMTLASRYSVELPQRPERWHRHQNTKAQMRDKMRMGLVKVYQRRLYRMFHDVGAHPEDDAALWDAMYPAAYLAATERVFG